MQKDAASCAILFLVCAELFQWGVVSNFSEMHDRQTYFDCREQFNECHSTHDDIRFSSANLPEGISDASQAWNELKHDVIRFAVKE